MVVFFKYFAMLVKYLPTIIQAIKALLKVLDSGKPEIPEKPPAGDIPDEGEEPITNEGYPENIQKFWRLVGKSKTLSEGQKIGIVAQSMLETGKGTSELSKAYNNFGGLMWRRVFDGNTQFYPVEYTSSSDGIKTEYLACRIPEAFYEAYIKFINRDIYKGWSRETSAKGYISFIHSCGYAADPEYVAKVSALFQEAAGYLGIRYIPGGDKENPIEPAPIPGKIEHPPYFNYLSPHKSKRTSKITHIVLHNTDTATFSSPVYWFKNPRSRVSAHAIIQRNPQDSVAFCGDVGKICIPVWERDKAWHAGNANNMSLGIEIVAGGGLKGMTPWQEKTTIQLIKHWMHKYGIKKENIVGHRTVSNTSCPVHIWSTEKELRSWVEKNF